MSTRIDLDPSLKYSIQGVNGSGKSVLFRYLLKQLLDKGCRVVIYDVEDEWAKELEKKYPKLRIYKPKTADSIEEFDKVAGYVYESRNVVFAVESIDFFATAKKSLSPNFKKIIHWGRRRGVGLITTSRLPADVHKNVLGLGAGLFLFNVYEPNAIKYLEKIVGKETAARLKDLGNGHFVYWIQGKAQSCNPVEEVTF